MKLDVLTTIDTIKDMGISSATAFGSMTGLDQVTVHPDPEADIWIKSIVAILAGIITRLITKLFHRKKKR
jgi:hypothetical protein